MGGWMRARDRVTAGSAVGREKGSSKDEVVNLKGVMGV